MSKLKEKSIKMEELILALQIMAKYAKPTSPTNCSHDVLFVDVDPELVSKEDIEKLEELGFSVGSDEFDGGFYSFKYGSC